MYWNQNIGDPIVMWLLKTLLLVVLFVCGYGISYRKHQNFLKYSICATSFYSLIEGLRWLRGVDYLHYYNDIATNFRDSMTTADPEFLYRTFCTWVHSTGMPVCFAFVFYSFLLITSFLCVLKHFRAIAVWALPLFYLITINGAENHIRQFLAIPFLLFAFSLWLDGNKKYAYLMLCIPPFIHKSSLFAILFFLIFIHLKVNMKKRGAIFISALYLLLALFWDINNLSSIVPYIQMLNIGDDNSNFANYTQDAERWFTNEGSMAELAGLKTSFINSLTTNVSALIALFFGYKIAQEDKKFFLPYWFTCISCFITCIGGDIELFGRFSEWLYIFYPLILAAVINYVSKTKKSVRILVNTILLFIYFIYGFLRYWGTPTLTGSGFIWDA